MNLYREIDRSSIQIDVLLVDENKIQFYEEPFLSLGGKIYKIPRRDRSPLKSLHERFKIFKLYRYGIVHVHVSRGIRVFDGLLAKFAGVKRIFYHSHTSLGKRKFKHILLIPIFRFIGYYFMSCSLEAGKYFFGKNIDKKKNFSVIKNAIYPEKFKYNIDSRMRIRSRLKIDDKIVMGFVGRLTFEKNLTFAIDVFKELILLNERYVFVIVGTGNERDILEEQAFKYGIIEKIIFEGSSDKVYEFMSAFDFLILPSLYEGLGIVLIEAQAANLKCYASDRVPKSSNIIGLVNFLSLSSPAPAWARTINDTLDNHNNRDADITASINDAGYNIISVAKTIEKLYLNTIS